MSSWFSLLILKEMLFPSNNSDVDFIKLSFKISSVCKKVQYFLKCYPLFLKKMKIIVMSVIKMNKK